MSERATTRTNTRTSGRASDRANEQTNGRANERGGRERASEPPGMRLERVPVQPAEPTRRRLTHGNVIDESRPRSS